MSHSWGQYSPYFKVPSEVPTNTPEGCEITFAQILSRHGARDPTFGKSRLYASFMDHVKTKVQNFSGDYAFLANYSYNLGADQLTQFGREEMINSGEDFFSRYAHLTTSNVPFIRASGQDRVIESAELFSQGFHIAKSSLHPGADNTYPYPILTIPETAHTNNTLSQALCPAFEAGRNDSLIPQTTFLSTFMPAITARLNAALAGANLTDIESLLLMDLCPFETVASSLGTPSPFCALFSQHEWSLYDYHATLSKYYTFGPGAPFGPTQGVGYANELIARLTNSSVSDHTSTNATLDHDPITFPLGRSLYADFGHDNDMTSAFAALGLYDQTPKLETERVMSVQEMGGYSASWTVPFAGRAIFEKMQCAGIKEEMIRVIVNERTLPLRSCGGDDLGRCSLNRFVDNLGFARRGGRWDDCFKASGSGVEREQPDIDTGVVRMG